MQFRTLFAPWRTLLLTVHVAATVMTWCCRSLGLPASAVLIRG